MCEVLKGNYGDATERRSAYAKASAYAEASARQDGGQVEEIKRQEEGCRAAMCEEC